MSLRRKSQGSGGAQPRKLGLKVPFSATETRDLSQDSFVSLAGSASAKQMGAWDLSIRSVPGLTHWGGREAAWNMEFFVFVFLFLAALGLRCCVRAFSSCGERGLLFVAVHGLLIAVASLVAGHGL